MIDDLGPPRPLDFVSVGQTVEIWRDETWADAPGDRDKDIEETYCCARIRGLS